MALVDPYAPCHCGSGQKYKWCCQSVEAYVERSQRLLDNGQHELAINPLLEGLAKVPDNVSLLLAEGARPASSESARARGRDLTPLAPETPGPSGWFDLDDQARPGHRGCRSWRGPVSAGSLGAHRPKIALSWHPWPRSSVRAWLARITPPRRSSISSSPLGSQATKPSSVASHSSKSASQSRASRSGRRIPIVSGRRLSTLPQAFRESFEQALGWAEEGLWSSAASAFELLAAGSGAGVIADRNRGLCCLWLADHEGAVAALQAIHRPHQAHDRLRRSGSSLPEDRTPSRYDIVDIDRLSWPIRNREGLLAALRADPANRAGRRSTARSGRPRVARAREFPAARSSRDRGQARPHPARDPAGRSRGARR